MANIETILRRIASGNRRPINPIPLPTTAEVYAAAEKEGMAVKKAKANRTIIPR